MFAVVELGLMKYLNANKDELLEDENEINIDSSKMIIYG
jgi:hypothetical protein